MEKGHREGDIDILQKEIEFIYFFFGMEQRKTREI